jgi:hypothetical protein
MDLSSTLKMTTSETGTDFHQTAECHFLEDGTFFIICFASYIFILNVINFNPVFMEE